MNHSGASKILIIISLMIILGIVPAVSAQDTVNFLTNPGFEDGFEIRDGDTLKNVATSWEPWTVERSGELPSYQNVAPKYVSASQAPSLSILPRVRTGEEAQIYFSFFETHDGGIYQQVSGITPGTELRFSIYAHVWSSTQQDFNVSEEPGGVALRVGIDPNGGTDAESSAVEYSTATIEYDTFRQYSIIATAESDTVTVFVRSSLGDPVENTYIYLDDAVLEPTTTDEPTEEPVVTDEPTEEPVVTEEPTEEPVVTDEPTEEPVVTDEPTEEPVVTDEPTEEPVVTDEPTEEPVVTDEPTEEPVVTDEPTEEPVVTDEPTEEPVVTDEPTEEPVVTDEPTEEPVVTQEATPTQETSFPTPSPTTDAAASLPGRIEYTVQYGDSVARIAQLYGSTIRAIIQVNGLDSIGTIYPNQTIIVPVAIGSAPTATPQPTATDAGLGGGVPSSGTTYVVQPNDNLTNIARRFGTTVNAIVQLNGILNPNRILVGQRLLIPGTVTPTPPQPAPTTYLVRPGDTLYLISVRFNVSLVQLAQLNNITNYNLIYTGQVLQIPR